MARELQFLSLMMLAHRRGISRGLPWTTSEFPQRLPLLRSVSVPRSTEDAKSRHLLVRNHCLLFLRLGLGGPCVSLSSCVSPTGTMGNLGKSRSRKSNIANGFGTFAGISAPACKLNPLPEKGMCAAATGDHPVLLSIVVVPF